MQYHTQRFYLRAKMSQSAFTCITCHVAFVDADMQRTHYKCDWHRYNLKRKVVALPPVSRESFNEKVAAQKAQVATNKSKENIVGFSCKVCSRKFNSFNSYNNHLKSKKHQEAESKEIEILKKKLQKDKELSHEEESEEQIAFNKAVIDARNKLQQPDIISSAEPKPTKKFNKDDNPRLRWYRKQVKAIEENDRNKEEEEDEECDEEWEDLSDDDTIGDDSEQGDTESQTESTCTDTSSLAGVFASVKLDSDADVESLASQGNRTQKLIGSTECLFCCRKSTNVENNVTHMSRAHGFFVPELQYLTNLEGLLSYLGEKVGVGNVCLWCNERGHAFYSLQAVQTHMRDKGHMKMLSDGDASLEYADFYDFSSSYPDFNPDVEEDEELPQVASDADEEDSELVLPSGARIGHRSLLRYYRQNFPPVERVKQNRGRIDRLMHQYRAIGWKGGAGMVALRKMDKDMKFVQRMKSKFQQKLSSNNNKTMMKHLRPQVVF
uniref:zinc finger protein 622 isoform X2 n=1 Tax=Ciona intestinalis TaxID=7719 RepID=UPI000EF50273|nr:zinc finger protein 622 isoform X2 [Ciona intestinalis]|eukprot:XP_026690810.1 zinc finger protein 622 isoform X2 [Ciona intestinalis]